MLRSMTGQGHASGSGPLGVFQIELRTVNNRGFKMSARLGDSLSQFDSQVDAFVRRRIGRGSVHLTAKWQRPENVVPYSINEAVVTSYFRQLDKVRQTVGGDSMIDLARLASLPGALSEQAIEDVNDELVWDAFAKVLHSALDNLDSMRDAEGAAMQKQLQADLKVIVDCLAEIQMQAPTVVEQYQVRLQAKIEAALQRAGLKFEMPELLREVQIFADRSDISEEITRLNSHIDLFEKTMLQDESHGRKLDFVIQEMLRETNTIGSKAGDACIAHHVVEIKCALERIRELIQNIE